MLALQTPAEDEAALKCTPHLLPCRIDRNGPVNALPRFWSPEVDKGNQPERFRYSIISVSVANKCAGNSQMGNLRRISVDGS